MTQDSWAESGSPCNDRKTASPFPQFPSFLSSPTLDCPPGDFVYLGLQSSVFLVYSWSPAVLCIVEQDWKVHTERHSKGDQPGTSQLGKPRTWLWCASPPPSIFPDFCAILVTLTQFRIVTPDLIPHSFQLVEIPIVSSRAWWFPSPYYQLSCRCLIYLFMVI